MIKKRFFLIFALIMGMISSTIGVEAEITVLGTVSDTGGNPVDRAIILITRDTISVTPTSDTIYSGPDGNFSKKIRINDNAIGVAYAASKRGYQTKYGYGRITGTTCNLGTIVLRKSGSGTRIVHVFGSVFNARTDKPVNEALVILTTTGNITDPLDSTYSGTDGAFYKAITIDSSGISQVAPQLIYRIEKEGFAPVQSRERIRTDTVDLGKITIQPNPTSIENGNPLFFTFAVANNIAIYSLKGQLIYTGTEMNIDKLVHLGLISRSQPIIISYKFNNDVLFITKTNAIK